MERKDGKRAERAQKGSPLCHSLTPLQRPWGPGHPLNSHRFANVWSYVFSALVSMADFETAARPTTPCTTHYSIAEWKMTMMMMTVYLHANMPYLIHDERAIGIYDKALHGHKKQNGFCLCCVCRRRHCCCCKNLFQH